MDRLFNNNWFIKIISFFIAFMLFLMVNMDQFNTQPGGVFPPGTTATYTLEDVELNAYYDEERFAITEMTETVQVNLRGPQGAITLLQLTRPGYEVYVDLQGREAGVHHVSIQHRGFPSEISVSVVPQFVRVVLQEKRTVSIPVEVDVVNKDQVSEGYTVGKPIVTPVNIEITAAEDLIAQVAIAKAYIDVQGENKTVERSVPVKIYDHQGNELHLEVDPSIVDVRVPITSPFKNVPIKVTREGELPAGLSISSISVEPKEVTIYGPQDVINEITLLEGVILDVSGITETQTVELPIPKLDGIERVEPEVVQVTVDIVPEESLIIEDVSIEVTGIRDGLSFELVDQQTEISIVLKGARPLLEKITKEEIQAFLDVSELSTGEHRVPIQIVGPRLLKFEPEIVRAVIKIYET